MGALVSQCCDPRGRIAQRRLVRALQPLEGIEVIRKRRGRARSDRQLTSGPACSARHWGEMDQRTVSLEFGAQDYYRRCNCGSVRSERAAHRHLEGRWLASQVVCSEQSICFRA
jgi:hypothetical protein